MKVTAQQIRDLWKNGGSIDRGDDYTPVTLEDFEGLDIDTDDEGNPTEEMWQVLADQVNSELPGAHAGPTAEGDLLDDIAAAARAITDAEEHRDSLIRAAIGRVPVTAIADAAGLTRARIYQIRDGRR
ncbi:hypothetical protein [Streptomyces sp. CC224B]|uniref:hypothetical protein n=1 Tax=Streptomyces sp. CC224B TaxID=3044571 RepID=UPI0024A9B1AE|nr:hypothetical protein [Streptomyces sp. CC224B]